MYVFDVPGHSDGGHSSGRFGERRGFRFDGGSGGGGRLPAGGQHDARGPDAVIASTYDLGFLAVYRKRRGLGIPGWRKK